MHLDVDTAIMCLLLENLKKLFAWGEGDSGGHVLRETTSRGLCGLVCPSRTVCVYYCSTYYTVCVFITAVPLCVFITAVPITYKAVREVCVGVCVCEGQHVHVVIEYGDGARAFACAKQAFPEPAQCHGDDDYYFDAAVGGDVGRGLSGSAESQQDYLSPCVCECDLRYA